MEASEVNPYDAELRKVSADLAFKRLSNSQADALLNVRSTVEGFLHVYIGDDRIQRALLRKGLTEGGFLTPVGVDVTERLFQQRFGHSIETHLALSKARNTGLKIKREAKKFRDNQRRAALIAKVGHVELEGGQTLTDLLERSGRMGSERFTFSLTGLERLVDDLTRDK